MSYMHFREAYMSSCRINNRINILKAVYVSSSIPLSVWNLDF